MARAFIAVGSNIDPCVNIPQALKLLSAHVDLKAVSDFYQTDPLGNTEQPAFVNGACLIATDLSPRKLKYDVLRQIECELGRVRTCDKNGPRTMDLDLVIYDDLVLHEPDLVLPDPEILNRNFIVVPVSEIDPDLIIPGENITAAEVAARLTSTNMSRLDRLSQLLRSEL